MTEKGKKYLSDILQSIKLIEDFTKELGTFENYQEDIKTKSAVERQLSIVGEAVNKYSKLEEELKLSYSKQIIGFRNRIIHVYDNIDDAIVWTIIKSYLPTLKKEVLGGLK